MVFFGLLLFFSVFFAIFRSFFPFPSPGRGLTVLFFAISRSSIPLPPPSGKFSADALGPIGKYFGNQLSPVVQIDHIWKWRFIKPLYLFVFLNHESTTAYAALIHIQFVRTKSAKKLKLHKCLYLTVAPLLIFYTKPFSSGVVSIGILYLDAHQ